MKIVLDGKDPADVELVDLILAHMAKRELGVKVTVVDDTPQVVATEEPVKEKAAPKPKAEKAKPKKDEITQEEHIARQNKVMAILREKGATAASEYVKAAGAGRFADLTPEQMKEIEAKLDAEAEKPKDELGF